MITEFTSLEINRGACFQCQCQVCADDKCPVKCTANIPCMAPLTSCPDYKLICADEINHNKKGD